MYYVTFVVGNEGKSARYETISISSEIKRHKTRHNERYYLHTYTYAVASVAFLIEQSGEAVKC